MCSGDRRFKQSPVTVRASSSCGTQIDQVCVAAISRAYGLANALSAGIRAEPIEAYVTSGNQLPNSCDQWVASCVLRIRSGLRSARRGDDSEALTLLNWPDALVRIAGPGPAWTTLSRSKIGSVS